ncbi:MAG TPA: PhoU domain-containing protein [Acidimicrobiales bacterium]|jgi:phosphate transport system protein|nr:PhoU domain-containing protein [Acidimicrobiales bacterium]
MDTPDQLVLIDRKVSQLFALVSEALAQSTHALLNGDLEMGRRVVAGDQDVDDLAADVERLVWEQIDLPTGAPELRRLIAILLILPELERSADLAEHVAQRAVDNLGVDMSPLSRGIVQRMAEVALAMWRTAADAYGEGGNEAKGLAEDDEEIDRLHDRLMQEIADEAMPTAIAAQVTLLARFYERLGDHAVNLARRIEVGPASS